MNDEKENIAENSNIGESAAPKRKPVIRKVSAAPTKFAPIRPKEENAAPPAPLIPFDEDFSEDDDAAAYAAAAEEDRRNAERAALERASVSSGRAAVHRSKSWGVRPRQASRTQPPTA